MIDESVWTALIEKKLREVEYPVQPSGLYRPISYTLEAGGKRLRPMLMLAACEAVGGKAIDTINQAIGLEMFHNFTLIHDDVMDRSAKRRGRPTVYHRWGDVQAILSGDALLTMATQYIVKDCPPERMSEVLALYNRTALEIYEGQQYDTANEKKPVIKVETYLKTIYLKTAVLIGCALAIGATMGGANPPTVRALYNYGINIGLAFQLRDDWLDIYGSTGELGKEVGNDLVTRKKTWLYIKAMEEVGDEFDQLLNEKHSRRALVSRTRRMFDSIGLSDRCDALIESYREKAIKSLKSAKIDENYKQWFITRAALLSHRVK